MSDKVLLGKPPGPGDYVKGMLWLVASALESDADGFTVKLDAYTYSPPTAVDWGDGTYSNAAWTQDTAPAGGAPGKYHVQHDYTKASMVGGYVEGGGLRARFRFTLGKPGRSVVARKQREKTKHAREDLQDAMGMTGVGTAN